MHDRAEHHPPATTDDVGARKPWSLLILLCVAQFMVILDVSVVNVALPSIRDAVGFAPGDLQWVVTAYVLMTGGLLLLGGRMADLLGRRRVFLAGLVLFTAASLASGLADSPAALIAARAAQGVGAAMLSPAALSLITTTYTGEQRAAALGAWGAIGGAGAAAGVLLGGVLTSWLGWRSVFFINVPTGLVTALLATRMLPTSRPAGSALRSLDLPGAVTLISGLVVLVYALEGTTSHGWGSARTLLLLTAAAGLLSTFALIERRARRPLMAPATWRVRSLISSATVMLGATGILVGTSFLNSLFLQNVLGASALETGLAFLPGVLVVGIAAHIAPKLLTRLGARAVVVGGLSVLALGELLLSGAPADAVYIRDLLPGFLLLGLGVGFVLVAVSVTAMSDIQADRAGLASGLMTTAHELGGAFGVAIFSAVALGAGAAAAGPGFVDGYSQGTAVGAAIAIGLAAVAAMSVPQIRPVSTEGVALH
jgi:EmrB/QacA subfamily drug resistance transporter